MKKILFTLCCCFLIVSIKARAQSSSGISLIKNSLDTIKQKLPIEKIYLHTDRPYYSTNDTLWFKAYLFEGPFLSGSSKSGILYAELSDATNQVIKRFKFPVAEGMSWGNITLNEADFKDGKYVLRAYTRWMLNFDKDYIYEKEIYISGHAKQETQKQPVKSLAAKDIDLQFLPEGGEMVAGISNNIAFKAVGSDGKGLDVKGEIKDHQNNSICNFQSEHHGTGLLKFQPKAGEKYRAILQAPLPGMEVILPSAVQDGIVLSVADIIQDSLIVSLKASDGSKIIEESSYYLIGHSRGVVCYAANLNFKNKKEIISKISKALFPSGVVRFSLFNSVNLPLNERAVYINHKDALKIEVQKQVYMDSVSLVLNVKDVNNNPIESTFSLSVTNDSLISIPALQSNIITRILLESDIKGYIENPTYYLSGTSDAAKALDLLMLTQGWTGYNWGEVFHPVIEPKFRQEKEFTISGKSIIYLTGKPRANALVALNSKKPMLYLDTLTDANGSFLFKNIPLTPNDAFLVIAKNAKGKDANGKIQVNEEKSIDLDFGSHKPVNLRDTDVVGFNVKRKEFFEKRGVFHTDGINELNEVVVSGKKIVKDSKNKNGAGKADIILNETDLKQVPEMTLLDLFLKDIKGFRLIRGPGTYGYAINNKPLKLVFDGTDPFYIEQSPETNFLENFKAKDVKGIEIMTSMGNVQAYQSYFNPGASIANMASTGGTSGMVRLGDTVFAEITTYGDVSSIIRQRPGMQMVRTIPFSVVRKFYNPKYMAEKDRSSDEFNPLVFWDPSILTGKDGKAKLNFYHKNKPGNYTLILEGSDMNGKVGYVRHTFTIKNGNQRPFNLPLE
jgi:hypothetical protein